MLEYKICYGRSTTVSTKHNCDNSLYKAFLNGLSSCDCLSKPFLKTEMAQLDKEKRETNSKLYLADVLFRNNYWEYFQHIRYNNNNVMRVSPKNSNGEPDYLYKWQKY